MLLYITHDTSRHFGAPRPGATAYAFPASRELLQVYIVIDLKRLNIAACCTVENAW